MKKVLFLLFVTVMLCGLVLIGCEKTAEEVEEATSEESVDQVSEEPEAKEPAVAEPTDEEPATDDKVLVVFANYNDTLEFCQLVLNGFKTEVEAKGWEFANLDNAGDGTTSVNNAKLAVSMGASVFVEFCPDETVGPAVMDIMNEADIPTLAIDIPLPEAPYFGASNLVAGKAGGLSVTEMAIEKWGDELQAAIYITASSGGQGTIDRENGFNEGVKENYPDLPDDKIISIDIGSVDILPAQEKAAAFLAANPDITKMVWGGAGDQIGSGVLAALEIAKREDQALIVTTGCDSSALDNLYLPEENAWKGSVSFAPELYGQQCIPLIEKLLAGETVAEITSMEHFTVTKDNVEQYYPR